MRYAGNALIDTGLLSGGRILTPEPNLNVIPTNPAFLKEKPVEVAELKVSDFTDAAAEADMTGNSGLKPSRFGIRGGGRFGGASGIDAIEDRYMDPLGPVQSGTYDPALRSFFPGV